MSKMPKEFANNSPNSFASYTRSLSNAEHVDKFLDRRRALLQRDALFGKQVDLDDLLQPSRAKFARDPNVETVDAILAFQIRSARKNLFLVLQDRLSHLHSSSRWSVIG